MLFYWYFFIFGIIALGLGLLFLAVLRPAIAPLRIGIRTAYNFAMGFNVIGILMIISAMIMKITLG